MDIVRLVIVNQHVFVPKHKSFFIHYLTLPVMTYSVRSFSEMSWKLGCNPQCRWAVSALMLRHCNYDTQIPYNELLIKWSQIKHRLIAFEVTIPTTLYLYEVYISELCYLFSFTKYHILLCKITCFLPYQNKFFCCKYSHFSQRGGLVTHTLNLVGVPLKMNRLEKIFTWMFSAHAQKLTPTKMPLFYKWG